MIILGALSDIDGIRHGFFTRANGVSDGLYASLNCGFGSNDDPVLVAENRRRVAVRMAVAPERLVTLHQIHSPTVVVVGAQWHPGEVPEADAMVTDRPGLALGILTADCVPVLMADQTAGVIGAAHAGWKGARDGVLEATVLAMTRLGASPCRMVAAIGPSIAQRSYEVGPDFPANFTANGQGAAEFFLPSVKPGHFMFDLPGLVERRLGGCGVAVIQRCANDTQAEEERFFSYRRATLRGEPSYGRSISVIVLGDLARDLP
ncbi:MAG: peptidoglycan editing factor PgeF [Rhodospirillaceae bacterium]